ncbi:DUF6415 family natural product biosynthesis protein [Streptomyces sp. MMG1121]|uniref:DUF6415 family natural product biosynthesis protein n=1 Tax=Streptomyces sp. MMG1121 TaxID=1415544 RepID=UPI00131DCDD2|nr:DUF6415 family natural product biosynthesis protein [Streptomyces sp. MMG1121]
MENWLLPAAVSDADRVRTEWETQGAAVLRCGTRFCAICVPLDVAEAAAGCTTPDEVDAYLAGALLRAPVIRSQLGQWLFVLCEPDTVKDWKVPGTECLGDGHLLGVPRPDMVGLPGRTTSCWAVPMRELGALGSGKAVSQLVSYGRYRMSDTVPNPQHSLSGPPRLDLDRVRQVRDEILHLTRDLPEQVPRRAQLEPAITELETYLEDLARWIEPVIAEANPADRQTVRWLLGRVRQLLSSEPPSTDREAATQAEDLALSCRALQGVYERHSCQWRGVIR